MNMQLELGQNLDDYDAFYDMLTETHQDLDDGQSKMLNAQLVLLLSSHIGDLRLLRLAFALARVTVEKALPR
jgi:hypothetical protein